MSPGAFLLTWTPPIILMIIWIHVVFGSRRAEKRAAELRRQMIDSLIKSEPPSSSPAPPPMKTREEVSSFSPSKGYYGMWVSPTGKLYERDKATGKFGFYMPGGNVHKQVQQAAIRTTVACKKCGCDELTRNQRYCHRCGSSQQDKAELHQMPGDKHPWARCPCGGEFELIEKSRLIIGNGKSLVEFKYLCQKCHRMVDVQRTVEHNQ